MRRHRHKATDPGSARPSLRARLRFAWKRYRWPLRLFQELRRFPNLRSVATYIEPGYERESMNGQKGRRRMVCEVASSLPFDAVVETGTNRGTTTVFLADVFGCRVDTVEVDPVLAELARRKLGSRPDVRVHCGDSRAILRQLAPGKEPRLTFFYLDAHWNEDLPLWEEVSYVLEHWSDPVILIDDFAVGDDPGYDFDDYGPGKVFDLAHLSPHVPSGARFWYPDLPSERESGFKRGCVLIAGDAHTEALRRCALREVSRPPA